METYGSFLLLSCFDGVVGGFLGPGLALTAPQTVHDTRCMQVVFIKPEAAVWTREPPACL